jgi:hypothetical protein
VAVKRKRDGNESNATSSAARLTATATIVCAVIAATAAIVVALIPHPSDGPSPAQTTTAAASSTTTTTPASESPVTFQPNASRTAVVVTGQAKERTTGVVAQVGPKSPGSNQYWSAGEDLLRLGTTQYSMTVDTDPTLPATYAVYVFQIPFAAFGSTSIVDQFVRCAQTGDEKCLASLGPPDVKHSP